MIQNIIYNSLIICLNFDLNFAKCWICVGFCEVICVSFAKKAKPKTKQVQKAQIKSNGVKKVSNKVCRSIKNRSES